MSLPLFLARPIFTTLYRFNRRGSPIPPIRREVQPTPLEQQSAFDRLLDDALAQAPESPLDYRLPYPKLDFLNYACDWRGYAAHGSLRGDLDTLQPVRLSSDSSEFGRRQQIFCSPDAIWAMWFAILDKSKIRVTQNGCVRVGKGVGRIKLYHFELPTVNADDPPYVDGMIYLVEATDFPERHPFLLLDWFDAEIEEWGSASPVKPLAKIPVSPQDFPYLDQVQFRL